MNYPAISWPLARDACDEASVHVGRVRQRHWHLQGRRLRARLPYRRPPDPAGTPYRLAPTIQNLGCPSQGVASHAENCGPFRHMV